MGQRLWEETIFFVEAELKNWTSASRITQILEDKKHTVETWFFGIRWEHLMALGMLYPQHLEPSRRKIVSLVVPGTLAKLVDITLGADLLVSFLTHFRRGLEEVCNYNCRPSYAAFGCLKTFHYYVK